ncbi:MAG TPA: trigger factor [Kiritimatiellia bacterium]|nr:trigger factor [Kiritimatiellia bacterium]
MNIQIEVVGPCRKQINIETPADEVAKISGEITGQYVKYAAIPGFRPGKAPIQLVKRRFQKEITKEVKERLLATGYQSALKQEKLKTIGVIDVTDAELLDGQPFAFQIVVDVEPEFEVPDYKAIRIEEKPVAVTEESIDEVVDRMRDRMATFEDSPDRKAEKSDRLMVDYTATIDGQPLESVSSEHAILAKAVDFGVILDQDYSFLPEFVEGLVGVAEGETKVITVSFDENFIDKKLAGKKADYTVNVKKVQIKKLPEMTEEFLKTLGAESVEKLRERIRKDLADMKSSEENRRIQNEICKKLLEDTVMNLPESVVQRRTAEEVYDMVEHNTQRGIDRGAIEENREQIFAAAAKSAEEKTKIRYILLAIAEKENITVSDQELDGYIRSLAMRSQKDPMKLKEDLIKNDRMGLVREDIVASKTLSMLSDRQKPEPVAG